MPELQLFAGPRLVRESWLYDRDDGARIEGRCIKHCMGPASVKICDKFGRVLRVETTSNDISFFSTTTKWNTATDIL